MVFPVVMYRCESWTIKKAEHRRLDVLELWYWTRLLGVPWIARTSSQSVLRKINPEIFIGRADDEAEAPKLWLSDAKSQFIGKDSDAGKDRGQEKKVGWHHQLSGHEFEQILGDSEGQGNLACCSPWGRKESDMT